MGDKALFLKCGAASTIDTLTFYGFFKKLFFFHFEVQKSYNNKVTIEAC